MSRFQYIYFQIYTLVLQKSDTTKTDQPPPIKTTTQPEGPKDTGGSGKNVICIFFT